MFFNRYDLVYNRTNPVEETDAWQTDRFAC